MRGAKVYVGVLCKSLAKSWAVLTWVTLPRVFQRVTARGLKKEQKY